MQEVYLRTLKKGNKKALKSNSYFLFPFVLSLPKPYRKIASTA